MSGEIVTDKRCLLQILTYCWQYACYVPLSGRELSNFVAYRIFINSIARAIFPSIFFTVRNCLISITLWDKYYFYLGQIHSKNFVIFLENFLLM